MADTKLKGVIELTAKPIKVDEAASKLKDTIQEAFRAGGAGGLSDAAGSAGTHLSGISNFGKTASSGLSGAAQNLKGLLSGALGAAESGTKSGLIASAGGLIEGLGVAALGGAGMAALGMVATIGFIKSLSAASHGLQDFNFKLGGDVGSMAVVKGILGLQNTMLQLQVGNKLAPSAMKLGEANFEFKSKLENALVPAIKELNNAFASMMISMTRLIPVIGETATALAGIVAWAAKHGGNAAVGVVSGMTGGAPPSAKTSVWTQAEYGIGQGIKNLLWYGGWDEASHGAKDLWDESKKEWSGVSNAAKETAGYNFAKWPWDQGKSSKAPPSSHTTSISGNHHLMGLAAFAHIVGVGGVGVHPLAKHASENHPTIGAIKDKQKAADAEKLLGQISKGVDGLNTKTEKTNNFLQQMTPEMRGELRGFNTFMDNLAQTHPGKGHTADRQQLWEDKFEKKVAAKNKSGVHALANPGWMKIPKKSPHTLKGYVNPDGAA